MAITSEIHTNEVLMRFDNTGTLIGMQYKQLQIVQDNKSGEVYSTTELGPFAVDIKLSEKVQEILGIALVAANEKILSLTEEIATLNKRLVAGVCLAEPSQSEFIGP